MSSEMRPEDAAGIQWLASMLDRPVPAPAEPPPAASPAVAPSVQASVDYSGKPFPSAYRDRDYESYAARRRLRPVVRDVEGEEYWVVEEGVSPLIAAPRQARHDPGPGVLGIDR